MRQNYIFGQNFYFIEKSLTVRHLLQFYVEWECFHIIYILRSFSGLLLACAKSSTAIIIINNVAFQFLYGSIFPVPSKQLGQKIEEQPGGNHYLAGNTIYNFFPEIVKVQKSEKRWADNPKRFCSIKWSCFRFWDEKESKKCFQDKWHFLSNQM
jgi:hypothetical protein